ncbi:signal transduction histidine kinase [Vibrio sp. RC586]|uniref:PAS domain-containing sensor histidine kinase n=1 Tax=Vibrio sp. RC586 TaxID=675815 RepID=UPI0001BB83D4|nr:ATP-binding protein [Vibrio sp. RC586]EEZ00017.1 signal transduction histidine kinase [Vibrio sp. RC586]
MRSRYVEEKGISPLLSRIGRRIILIMVLLSGAVTLVMTLAQTYVDYNREFNNVEARHVEIQTIHAELLATSLWNYDLVVLRQRLEGLENLPHIDFLQITSGDYHFEAGQHVKNMALSNTYPLLYTNPETGLIEKIGDLYVESDAQEIYNYLIRQFLVTLAVNALKTAIVCYVILVIFHSSVNQRIFAIAQFLRQYNPRHPKGPLELNFNHWIMEKNDELQWLADETNKITDNVTILYRNIKSEQERLADFAQAASDWLWETDADGALIYASEPMEEALTLPEVKHIPFQSIPPLRDASPLLHCIQTRQDFSNCETKVILHDGQEAYLLFQGVARYDEQQQFLGFRGTAINITSLKQAQLSLETMNQSLEQLVAERTQDLEQSLQKLRQTQEQLIESEKLAALGGLVAGVAHEVNTPLGIAVTATSVIQETREALLRAFQAQTLTSQQFSELLEHMTQSSSMLETNLNRAAKLIRDFKQTAVDQVSESRSQFNVKQVLEALLASLHAETRKIPVEPQIAGDSGIVMNSLPGVLTQIVTNLVMNSLTHAFSEQPSPHIEIHFYEQENNIILEYRDNGCGVPPELHQKIFEPFFTTKRGSGGSGLGLNLVFNLVKQKLKGELEFESEIGHGVHYTIMLPKVLQQDLAA